MDGEKMMKRHTTILLSQVRSGNHLSLRSGESYGSLWGEYGDQTVKRWDLKKKEWREHHCATMQLGQRGRGDVVLAELEGGELIRLRTHEGVILAEVTRWRYATDTEQRSIDAREEWRSR